MKTHVFPFLMFLFHTCSVHAQDNPDLVVHYDSAYLGGYSVGLRETFTLNNLKLDEAGNIYVGFGHRPLMRSDYVTYSLNPDGTQRWMNTYAGSAGQEDLITCLDVSADGTCCVSGYAVESGGGQQATTIQYNSAGTQAWMAQVNDTPYIESRAQALVMDKNGNVYVAVTGFLNLTNSDLVLVKYNRNGQQQWIRRYDRNLGPDRAAAVALSHDHSFVFLCGTTNNTGSGDDLSVIAFGAASGNKLWEHHYDFLPGTANPEDAVAIACDTMGHVFATGNSYSGSNNDIVLLKLRGADGTKIWDRRYDDTLKGNDGVFDLAVSDFGNIYLGGHTIDGLGGTSFLLLKYNANGGLHWRSAYAGSNLKIDRISNLEIGGPNGDIYVAGSANTGINQSYEFVALRYDPSTGDTLWTGRGGNRTWSGSGITNGLAVSDDGRVYVTGRTNSASVAFFNPDRVSAPAHDPEASLRVYPNPSNGLITIESDVTPIEHIEVMDLFGRSINSNITLIGNRASIKLDKRGMLFLKVETSKGIYVHRLQNN